MIVQKSTKSFIDSLTAQLPKTIDPVASAFVSLAITLLSGDMDRDEVESLLDIAQETVEPSLTRPNDVVLRPNSAAAKRLRRMPAAGNA